MRFGHRKELSAEALSAFVDGELGRREYRRVSRHLEACEPCRRYVEHISGMAGSLGATQRPALSQSTTVELQHAYAGWVASRS